MPKLSKIQRRVKREVNRKIARQRYRLKRKGSPEIPKTMEIEYKEPEPGKVLIPTKKQTKSILQRIKGE